MSTLDIPDPRAWPAQPATSAAAELHRRLQAALDAQTSSDEERNDAEARRVVERWLTSNVAELRRALDAAPSVEVARHLRRLLVDVERESPAQSAALRTVLFAIPVILVTALAAGAKATTIPGVIQGVRDLESALREAREFSGAQTFALSATLSNSSAIDIEALGALLADAMLPQTTELIAPPELELLPAEIVVDSTIERVHLRFVVGAVLAAPGVDPMATSTIERWGMAFVRTLAHALRASGVSLLALPRPADRLVRALASGRAAQREVSAQIFASNAIRKLRASVGEPSAVISAHRIPEAPNGGELRLSLSSPFAPREAEGFRCPLYPYETVRDVASMLVTLLRDCRVERVALREGVHPDIDPVTHAALFFKDESDATRIPGTAD